jgi:hypothetical protein
VAASVELPLPPAEVNRAWLAAFDHGSHLGCFGAHSAGCEGAGDDGQLSTLGVRVVVEKIDDLHEQSMTLIVTVRNLERRQNPWLTACQIVPGEEAGDRTVTLAFLELRKRKCPNQMNLSILPEMTLWGH